MRLPVQDQTMPRLALLAFAGLLLATPAAARITDREQSCADWLKSGGHRKSEYTASVAEKIRAFCTANPKMKAADAEMTMTGD